ncbi:hypothetical protein FPZ24_08610 [Sphingomonas panacisoli]|uniref:Uncharacterized protein n=1 Tax=Sphingomonas panacisoli TaxID=1813879 RepID=A0A5B8LI93_9SPHN|nr:hypothetical protein [Sphingomonas panacisoli]QDZ07539.1 hypothetical protein FPZ24_08610 [Sphingomonas panacisoli]
MNKTMRATIALWMGMAATTAQAAETKPCLTDAEAQSVFLALAPDTIRAVATKCTPSLPETATLRSGLAAFVAPYDAAATAAWATALPVIGKMAGPDMKGMDPAALKPMMGPMVGAMASEKLKPADCLTIERAVSLVAPLPPANVAGLAALAAASGTKGGKGPFAICPAATAAMPPAPK